jgi:hypothetical protein
MSTHSHLQANYCYVDLDVAQAANESNAQCRAFTSAGESGVRSRGNLAGVMTAVMNGAWGLSEDWADLCWGSVMTAAGHMDCMGHIDHLEIPHGT